MSDPPTSGKPHLVRGIGLGSGVALVVGGTIGSGIFRSPSGIAELLPGPLPMLGVWIFAGLLVLSGALTTSEVASAYPYSGGNYVYIREAYGRMPAFLVGWAQLILGGPAACGAVAIVFAQYALTAFAPSGTTPEVSTVAAVAIGALLVVTASNIVGLKFGSAIQTATVVGKLAGILALIVLALVIGLPRTGGHFTPAMPSGSFAPSAFGLALVSVLWAYDGWLNTTYVSGEFSNPRRNIPRALLIGILVIIAVYVLTNVAYLSVSSVGEISKSSTIASDTMGKLVGPVGITVIGVTVMISTFGTLSASMLTNPRVFFAMAEDRLFFPAIASVHPRFRTPHIAILLTSALSVVYVGLATIYSGSKAFSSLTDAFIIGAVPFYILTVASVFIFRRRERMHGGAPLDQTDSLVDTSEQGVPHRYAPSVRVPLYPVLPIVFIAANLFLLLNSLIDSSARAATMVTLGMVLVGIPIYYSTLGRTERR